MKQSAAAQRPATYILAGGSSTRFGSDKARALLHGRPMIRHVADAVASCIASVTVVAARADQYADLYLRTLADVQPGLGPIGGLETALRDAANAGATWVLLLSTDFVTLKPGWIEVLLASAVAGVQAVAFRGEHVEPLCALYHTSILPVVSELIKLDQRALHQVLQRVSTRYLRLPADWPKLAHVNTPELLRQAAGAAG